MNSVTASGVRVFAFSALLLAFLLTNSPRANATDIDMGVIANGSQVTGTLDYGDVLIWKFYAVAGTYGIVTSASTLADSADFKPRIQLTYPDDTNISTSTAWPGVRIQKNQTFNQSGWYKIKVDHYGPSGNTATARVNLVVTYQPYVVDSGTSGGIVYSGTDVNGTIPIKGMNMDTWSVAVNAGDDVDVDMTSEAGKTARMLIYEPDGSYLKGQISTAPSLRITPSQSVTGTYLILTGNHYATYTDPNDYTLAIDGATGLPEIAKADGSTCLDGCIGGVAVGDPINVATGALFEQVTDYSTVGTNPLAFTRFYNSQSYMRGLHPTMMGENWRSTYDRYLRVQSSTAVAAEREDGRVVNFTYSGGNWNTDSDVDYVLYNSGSLWTLTDRNDTVESYTETGDIGKLDSITLRNGYEQSLSYSSSTGLLSSVTDTYGRAFGMSYSSMGVLTQLTTPDTLTLSYDYIAYSSQRVLETVGYNTSPATELTYLYENSSLPFALTGVTDENGDRYNTWAYDGAGRVTSAQRALGDGYTGVAYSSTGNHTVTGPLGIEETYYFSELQNMPKVTQIDRASNGSIAFASRGFNYDSNGYLATRTDWNGNLTAWTNNDEGNPTKIVYASNTLFAQTTDITYNSTWSSLPATITTNGVTESLSYDSSGNLTSRTLTDTTSHSTPYSTNGDLRTWAYTYVSSGLLASVQLPRTDVTAKTDYDYTDGVLTKITDALGYETDIISYKSGGLPLTVEDPNGVQTSFTYNVRNWLTGSTIYTSAGNYTTALTYDSAGNLTKQTLADGSYLSYDYDDAHRLTGISNALSESQAISYNSAGLVTSRLWKNSGGTTKRDYAATYDALGRMLTSVGGEGQTTTYTYDANGNVLTITYPRGNKITQTWDVLDRLATSANDLGDQSTITYDSHNRVLTVTDPKSNVTSYVRTAVRKSSTVAAG